MLSLLSYFVLWWPIYLSLPTNWKLFELSANISYFLYNPCLLNLQHQYGQDVLFETTLFWTCPDGFLSKSRVFPLEIILNTSGDSSDFISSRASFLKITWLSSFNSESDLGCHITLLLRILPTKELLRTIRLKSYFSELFLRNICGQLCHNDYWWQCAIGCPYIDSSWYQRDWWISGLSPCKIHVISHHVHSFL